MLIISSNVYSQSPVYSYTGNYSGTPYYDNYYIFSRLKGKTFPVTCINYNFGLLAPVCLSSLNSCFNDGAKKYLKLIANDFGCTNSVIPSFQLYITDTLSVGNRFLDKKNISIQDLNTCGGSTKYGFGNSNIIFGLIVVDKPTFFTDFTENNSKDTLNLKTVSSLDSIILTKEIKSSFDFIVAGIDTQSVKLEYPTFINTSSPFGATPQNIIKAEYGTIQSRTTFYKNTIRGVNTITSNPHRSGILLAANTGLTPGEYSGDIIVSHLNGDEIQRIRVHYTEPQVTGLDANLLGSEINISPNPSTGIVSFNLPSGENKISIIQPSTGNTSFYVSTNNELLTEDLSHLAKGVYIVKIQNQSSVYTHKLILQ